MDELSEFIIDEISKFIKAHVNEINNNNFAKVYEDTNDSLTPCLLTSKLTELFLDAGLEPLEYMQAVPANYLAYSKLTSITIPENITSIGRCAFSGCDSLTSITIPDSVTSIGSAAFENCSGLTSIVIPDSVTSIDHWAFNYCTGLTSVTIGNGVTSIDNGAFSDCEELESVIISGNITSINEVVFDGCKGLKSVTIPASVTSIGKSAFRGCRGLTITFNGTKAQWDTITKEPKWKYTSSKFTIHCTDGDLMI